jgi:hypothetical protein
MKLGSRKITNAQIARDGTHGCALLATRAAPRDRSRHAVRAAMVALAADTGAGLVMARLLGCLLFREAVMRRDVCVP